MKLSEMLATSQGSRSATLDGVRGLSVIILMLYHFGVSALQGAWIGLSIFFVFSGYVIVMIMLKENARQGRIDYIEFYRRRARRLLPALFLMIAVIAGWAYFFADNAVRRPMKGDILATLAFVMNWRLIRDADQYFVEFANPSYFRHVWTLSVEEQFYVVAPFLVAWLIKNVGSRKLRVAIVVALATASAIAAAKVGVSTTEAQAHVYYGTDTRVQSLLSGMAVAFAIGPDRFGNRPPPMSQRTATLITWFASAVFLTSFFMLKPLAPFMFESGGMLAFSLLAAVGLAASVEIGPGIFRKIFTSTPLVYLGILTYGLYLWHWPVKLWLDRYLPDLNMWQTLTIGSLATFVFAVVSFHLLELPVMLGGLKSLVGTRSRARMLAAGSVFAVVFAAVAVGRVPTVQEDIAAGRVPNLVEDTEKYVPTDEAFNAAMYGDSVPYYLAERFPSEVYSDINLQNMAIEGCGLLPLATYWAPEYQEPVGAKCRDGRANLEKRLKNANTEALVLMVGSDLAVAHQKEDGAVFKIGDDGYREMVEEQLDLLLSDAKDAGVQQVQLATLPCREMSARDLGNLPFDTDWYEENPEIARNLADPTIVNGWFTSWAEHNDVPILDLYGALGCERGFAPELNGIQLFQDAMHFSEEAAPMIWTWLAPAMRDAWQDEPHIG